MEGVSTIVLGVKNRRDLSECIAAEEQGLLDEDILRLIDESVG